MLVKEEKPEQFVTQQDGVVPLGFLLNIIQMIDNQAQDKPDAIAIECENEAITYGVLRTRSNQFAHHLRRQEIGVGDRIAVCLERSSQLIITLFGVLKAGGTYVPLDPNMPKDRLTFIINDAQVSMVVSKTSVRERFPKNASSFICWEQVNSQIIAEPSDELPINLVPENPAYITYTSGSTGKPKGVLIPHQGLSNIALEQQRLLHTGPENRVLLFSSISFDASIFEILMALSSGGTLVIPPPPRLRTRTVSH